MITSIKDIVIDAYNNASKQVANLIDLSNRQRTEISNLQEQVLKKNLEISEKDLKIKQLQYELDRLKTAHDHDTDGIAWFGQMLADKGSLYCRLSNMEELQEGDIVFHGVSQPAIPGTYPTDDVVAFRVVSKPTEVVKPETQATWD